MTAGSEDVIAVVESAAEHVEALLTQTAEDVIENSTSAAAHNNAAVVTQFWTEIDTGRTGAGRYSFFRYNLAGVDYIIWADGANHASNYKTASNTRNPNSIIVL